jgi:hypothetical protein
MVATIAALAIVAAAPGCATVETAIVAQPDVAFSLPLGKSASVNGTGARITFRRVTEDSRCAVDVTCVWAGNAKIELAVSRNGSGDDVRVLSLTPPNSETSSGDLRIRFVGLAPVPRQSDGSASRAYVAQLVVTRG